MKSSSNPFFQDCFPIDWSQLDPGLAEEAVRAALADAETQVAAIEQTAAAKCTYESVILPLDRATASLDHTWSLVGHLDSVKNSPALREVKNRLLGDVSDFYSGLALRPKLWQNITLAAKASGAEIAADPVKARHTAETLEDFKDSGADLPAEKRSQLLALRKRLAEVTQKFSENVLDATNAWGKIVTDPALLEGLPADALEAARENALAKGHGTDEQPAWRFTLQMPSFLPVMKFAHNEDLRRELWTAASQVGRQPPHDNLPLIAEILSLRKQIARLLGHNNFADWVTRRRMVGSGRAALSFVEDLHDKILEHFQSEVAELREFRAAQSASSGDEPLEPWDLVFWSERLLQQKYHFDEEQLRPYFSLESVVSGMFALVERIFGLKVEPVEHPFQMWDDAVRSFVLKLGDETLGFFYTDWFPRENKRDGAWMNPLFTPPPQADGSRRPPTSLMCGNLTPATTQKPSLLRHREVETIFHEFGHLLHHLCSRSPVRALHGTNVAWDFVELPSQIMENWCWERESLDLFARHYQTGEPIPEELFAAMRTFRKFQAATGAMRQLYFGKADLELHLADEPPAAAEIDPFIDAATTTYRIPTRTPAPGMAPRFTHLFASGTGYAAGYYSYKFAEVLDADAFGRFLEEGILNPQTGASFRRNILEQGNLRPPGELFREFRGRDPDPAPLLRRVGLA